MDSPWLGPEKNGHEGSQIAGKRYIETGSCKYSKCFFQLYVPSTTVQALRSLQLFRKYLILTM